MIIIIIITTVFNKIDHGAHYKHNNDEALDICLIYRSLVPLQCMLAPYLWPGLYLGFFGLIYTNYTLLLIPI